MEVSVVWFHPFTSLQLKKSSRKKEEFLSVQSDDGNDDGQRGRGSAFIFVGFGAEFGFGWMYRRKTSRKRRRVERVLLIHQAPRCGIASCFASITNPARILEQFCSCLTLAFSFSSSDMAFAGSRSASCRCQCQKEELSTSKEQCFCSKLAQQLETEAFHQELAEERIPS